jgi:hypothetical protein
MEIGGPVFRRFAELLTQRSIRVYGVPSESAFHRVREKAEALGCEDVVVEAPHAGLTRLAASGAVAQPLGSGSTS